MAVAEATAASSRAGEPTLARRATGALLGLAALGVAVALYLQIGALGLTLPPAVVLVLCAVPLFLVVGMLARRLGVGAQDHRAYPMGLALPSLSFYAAFFIIPLSFLVLFALSTPVGLGEVEYGFDLSNFGAVLDSSLYIEVFLRTLRQAAVGTLMIILIGFPLAYWIARYVPANRKNVFLLMVIVPFWTSFMIRTYSFLIVLAPEFFLSDWLQSLGLTSEPLNVIGTATALQIGLVYNYLPLFVLPLYATLERMDWRLVDAATDLGATGWAAFRQVTLRLSLPGAITGALLVFIPMMGEYIIPIVLGGGRVDFIGNVIARSFIETQDYAFGAALAMLVMGALSFFLVLYLYLSTRSEDATYEA